MNFNGISKIQVSNEALQAYFNRFLSTSNCSFSEVNVKFDNRPNIISTFAKVIVKGDVIDFRFYTSAIFNQWEDVFITSDGVSSPTGALVFIFTYLLTKVLSSKKDITFDVKNNFFDIYRNDPNFIDVSERFPSLFNIYLSLVPHTQTLNIADVLDMPIKRPYPEIPEEQHNEF